MRMLLALRALLFLLLFPGTVAGYLPYAILRASDEWVRPELSARSALAVVVWLGGVGVLLRCVWDFFAAGRGTLAPLDPPKVLVVRGMYRFTRNPMYNGVVTALLGETWLFGSRALLIYAAVVLGVFHLFVVLYEEPALARAFGESYRRYRRRVPRWGFTVRASEQEQSGR